MALTVSAVAAELGLTLKGADREITGVNTLENAGPDEISFLSNVKYARFLPATRAGAVIVPEAYADKVVCALVSDNPYRDFGRTLALFAKPQGEFSGVASLAFIHPEAKLGENVTVYPFAYIGPRAVIGAGCVIYPGCYVGEDCALGANTTLYPNVTLMAGTALGDNCIIHPGAALGADGFGFARTPFGIQKIPQVGTVALGNGVEFGANSAADRAVLGVTRIGDGTKIDNLVQIGHNVTIGKESFIVAQAGIAGSAKIGARATIAGQAGIAGHLAIGDDVTVAPQSGVAKDIPDGATCGGTPCVDAKTFMRTLAVMPKLPDMHTRLRRLEDEIGELRRRLAGEEDS